MNTIKTKCDKNKINIDVLKEAKEILLRGGLVAFPTETVYGLGGHALNKEASKKIYAAKGRPSDNPLIVHISSTKEVFPLVKEVPEAAKKLMTKFWPGPMTLVFNKSDIVPKETTGGLDTVAIRMPSHPVAGKLIELCGFPIAAPSANSSGRPSPTSADHVIEDLDGKVDMIIDGGPCDIGLESTIIDVTGETPIILRPGYISLEEVKDVCGSAELDSGILVKPKEDLVPKAPGMKYRHYAPKGSMTIIKGDSYAAARKIIELVEEALSEEKTVGILCDKDTKKLIEDEPSVGKKILSSKKVLTLIYGEKEDGISAAKNLYSFLRKMDEAGASAIFATAYMGSIMSGAINNRMLKAAGYNEINV